MFYKVVKQTVENQPKIVKNRGPGWFWELLGEVWEAFWSQGGPKLKKSGSLAALGVTFGEAFWILFGTGSFQIDFCIVFLLRDFKVGVFLQMLSDFRVRNLGLFQVIDMPEV